MSELTLEVATLVALSSPALLLAAISLASLAPRPLPERWVAGATGSAMVMSMLALAIALATCVATGGEARSFTARTWFSSHEGAFRFDLLVDTGALAFALLAATICGVVARFSFRYLHREPGFHRYFVLFSAFALGMQMVALAGSIEVLFAGWELVGLSSALLVAFFHERPVPVTNGLRVFAYYRLSDAAMLIAAALLHVYAGDGSLHWVFGAGDVPPGLSQTQTTLICVFLIVAVAGKSALLPLSSWLPRAMEGPTSSSAVYYGSLSVHAGCYLLWRATPLLEQSPVAQGLAIALGAATALFATLVARVQTDVKSALAFASLTQVGLIVLEIALGLRTLAFVHMAGHASLRLLQFLTAPSVLHDLHALQAERPASSPRPAEGGLRLRLYRFALERGHLDEMLDRLVVAPFRRAATTLDRFDRALAGETTTRPEAPRR
ncbi:MAG: proton-conducting transporter membrane subunit [Myxococcota bacterium]